jgi:hypothetical protein
MRRKLGWVAVLSVTAACGSSGEPSGAAGAAPADARSQALSYAKDPIACTADADCCVVFDGCRAQGLIVPSKDKDTVAQLLASAPKDMCVGCVAPSVQLECASGACKAYEMVTGQGADPNYSEGRQNHCGKLAYPTGWQPKHMAGLWAPPGTTPQKVIGCQ